MLGKASLPDVTLNYSEITTPGVRFVRETITSSHNHNQQVVCLAHDGKPKQYPYFQQRVYSLEREYHQARVADRYVQADVYS